ncbi:MAG: prepilin peptidase [Bryobacterales bacterium]|nr:prepilin peptidase [Bryobacterales bacterium]
MTTAAALVGLAVGSFLNVCILRWPRGESVLLPRSRCPSCGVPIAWHDNIPLLSFAILRARCRSCRATIPIRYPLVELATAVLFASAAARFGLGLVGAKVALFGGMCVILFWTDLERLLLPDHVTLGGLGVGLALSPLVPLRPGLAPLVLGVSGWHLPPWGASLFESCLTAVVLGGLLYATGEAYFRLRGVEGLGFGDVKFAAMIGAFLGSSEAILVLLAACLLGSAAGVALLVAGHGDRHTPLPFGSFLAVAAALAPFCADPILNWYWEYMLR